MKKEFQLNDRLLGIFISVIFHLLILTALALIIFNKSPGLKGVSIDAAFEASSTDLEIIDTEGTQLESDSSFEVLQAKTLTPTPTALQEPAIGTDPVKIPNPVATVAETKLEMNPLSQPSAGMPILKVSGLTKGRTQEIRKRGLPGRTGETTPASENAVERGLLWLAAHQFPDGGWSFDLTGKDLNGREGPCKGACSNTRIVIHSDAHYQNGLHPSRTAATALALLPYLGAGYSHLTVDGKVSQYQRTIQKGIDFLKYRAVRTENGYDFREGLLGQGMYVQGIVVLALCEAYEISGDETLRNYAQEGIRFIEAAQREDGGWRYHIPQDTDFIKDVSGDTAVTGWQVMALKSALSAGLTVRPGPLYKVGRFLDSVQNESGSLYHYLPLKNESGVEKMYGTTAVGLLVRQYLGWRPDHPGMKRGIDHLTEWIKNAERDWQQVKKGKFYDGKRELAVGFGEEKRKLFVYNIYFTFYASLVLQNIGGSDWQKSFEKIRTFLTESQVQGPAAGHENGSWLFYDIYMNDGGRLLNTVLAILILETPYRYLPLYNTPTR